MCLNYAYETVEPGDYCSGTGSSVSVIRMDKLHPAVQLWHPSLPGSALAPKAGPGLREAQFQSPPSFLKSIL